MKTIGILGGIGPESTIDYYKLLLKRSPELGGSRSPQIVINSVDFWAMRALLEQGDAAGLAEMLARDLDVLARAGAGVAIIAANTPHMVFDQVQPRAGIPLVSIVEATLDAAEAQGLRRLGLLGTRFTMLGTYYGDAFTKRGMAIVAPDRPDLDYVHDKYVGELVEGTFLDATRGGLVAVIERLRKNAGVDGVILGGTELPLILRDVPFDLPLLDTTRIHVDAVLRAALRT
ncbi:MAG TPA: amino acid racemase [Vicinamibacterales bacterium]|nr:amino acid racemase [Vicinamibacterales bacterium]